MLPQDRKPMTSLQIDSASNLTRSSLKESPTSYTRPGQGYAEFVRWVRKSHGWVGLWGAVFGLIFGFSGFWLNHRAVLKLPPMAQQRTNAQLALPDPPPTSADAMRAWLQFSLGLTGTANSVRIEPSKPVPWKEKAKAAEKPDALATADKASVPPTASNEASLVQPERWVFNFGGPNEIVQADYWRGNRSVGVTTTANGLVATLTNMHKGTGMTALWILLIDTWAGSLIFLSLSGVILWVQTNRRRAAGVAIFSTALLAILALTLTRL